MVVQKLVLIACFGLVATSVMADENQPSPRQRYVLLRGSPHSFIVPTKERLAAAAITDALSNPAVSATTVALKDHSSPTFGRRPYQRAARQLRRALDRASQTGSDRQSNRESAVTLFDVEFRKNHPAKVSRGLQRKRMELVAWSLDMLLHTKSGSNVWQLRDRNDQVRLEIQHNGDAFPTIVKPDGSVIREARIPQIQLAAKGLL